jgi:hypothetical protein
VDDLFEQERGRNWEAGSQELSSGQTEAYLSTQIHVSSFFFAEIFHG